MDTPETTESRAQRNFARHPRIPTPPANDAAPQQQRPFASEAEEDAAAAALDQGIAAVIDRPPLRPAMRTDDPRTRAAQRAAEIRGHDGGDLEDGHDEFYIAPGMIPEGWSYEWKTMTVYGAEDPAYQVSVARAGWEAVPAERHPEMMPVGWPGNTIDRKGQRLFERPQEITAEAQSRELRRARQQVRVKEQQLSQAPDGQFGRDHPQARPRIQKGYSPVAVPADE